MREVNPAGGVQEWSGDHVVGVVGARDTRGWIPTVGTVRGGDRDDAGQAHGAGAQGELDVSGVADAQLERAVDVTGQAGSFRDGCYLARLEDAPGFGNVD